MLLNNEMRRTIDEQKLGFVASVDANGRPNVSPRGTLAVLDDTHLVFADICSPGTTENLRQRPAVEVNVVDQVRRKGYRFSGTARVVETGAEWERLTAFYSARGSNSRKRCFIVIEVDRAAPLVSPAYQTQTEDEVVRHWSAYWERLMRRS